MVDITPLYELVQLVTDFMPVVLIIVVVLFFFGLLFLLFGGAGNNKLRIDKKMKFLFPLLVLMVMVASSPGQGAVGIDYDAVPINATIMTVKLTGLTVDTEYTIYASSNTETFTNITMTANSATEFVPVPVLDETDGYYLIVVQSSGGANINTTATTGQDASIWVSPRDAGDLLPVDAFFDLMVPIILIVIVVAVVVGFVASAGSKNRMRKR